MSTARRPREKYYGGHGGSDAASRKSESPLQSSLGRRVFAGFLIFGLAWIGWRIIADTASTNLAATDPEIAVAWMPASDALEELATREMTKAGGDLDAARSLAERALRASPLEATALKILGLIAERQGDQARADRLMRLSGALTWRDPATQAWLVKREIQTGEFGQALLHIDALMRVNRDVDDQTFPVLAAFTIDKRTFDVLENFLAAAPPPWRGSFLSRLSDQLPDSGRLVQLYAALKDSPHPPDVRELGPYLNRLVRDGRFAEAYQSWQGTLSPQQRTQETHPYNGDFAAPIDGLPFNWLLRSAAGVNIQIVASRGNADSHALQLQFSGARAGDFTVGQLMVLPPGEYRLTGKMQSEALRAERGLRWHIFCGDRPNETLGTSKLVTNSAPLADFSVDFTVPSDNCRAQWLKLEIPDRTASERQIEGQIRYENISIEQVAKIQQPAAK